MDVNECLIDLNRCQQVCMNTDGSFRCECESGFRLNSDQNTCAGMKADTIEVPGLTNLILIYCRH